MRYALHLIRVNGALTIRYITTRYYTTRYITTRHITTRHITTRHITTHYTNISPQLEISADLSFFRLKKSIVKKT
jgi:hypothetical protein